MNNESEGEHEMVKKGGDRWKIFMPVFVGVVIGAIGALFIMWIKDRDNLMRIKTQGDQISERLDDIRAMTRKDHDDLIGVIALIEQLRRDMAEVRRTVDADMTEIRVSVDDLHDHIDEADLQTKQWVLIEVNKAKQTILQEARVIAMKGPE